jgi:tRNA pseudouridine38-40 synthase
LHGAGRTDAGVHALAQVANFHTGSDLSLTRIRRAVNALGGGDLIITAAEEAAPDFDARRSARGRHYLYLVVAQPSALWAGRAARWGEPVDIGRMNAAAALLVGRHDFAGFSVRGDDEADTSAQVFYAVWEPWPRGIKIRIGAVRFLYKMVRCIAAACLEVGGGRLRLDAFQERLASPGGRARRVAPACGLYFVSADYGDPPAWGPDCLPRGPVL